MTELENDELIGMIVRRSFLWEGLPSIAVQEWGRDCDQFESINAFILAIALPMRGVNGTGSSYDKALFNWPLQLLEMYLEREAVMEDNKEGPCSMHIMTKANYLEFHPSRRDHRAEQYGY